MAEKITRSEEVARALQTASERTGLLAGDKKVASLAEVRSENDAAGFDRRASTFRASANSSIEFFDGKIAGYALVVWDKKGGMYTGLLTGEGPFDRSAVPTLAGHALNRHVTVEMVEDGVTSQNVDL